MTGSHSMYSIPERSRTIALVRHGSAPDDDPIPEAVDADVVLYESLAHAYTTIKRAQPDLVVICLTDDFVDGCQVMSMLALNPHTSQIPVLTYAIEPV